MLKLLSQQLFLNHPITTTTKTTTTTTKVIVGNRLSYHLCFHPILMLSGPHLFCFFEDTSDMIKKHPLWRGQFCSNKNKNDMLSTYLRQRRFIYWDDSLSARTDLLRRGWFGNRPMLVFWYWAVLLRKQIQSSKSLFTAFHIYFPTVSDATLYFCEKVCPSRRSMCPSVCMSIFPLTRKKRRKCCHDKHYSRALIPR